MSVTIVVQIKRKSGWCDLTTFPLGLYRRTNETISSATERVLGIAYKCMVDWRANYYNNRAETPDLRVVKKES